MNPEHVAWCKTLFASLKDGGIYGVPRSGLMFRKNGDKLVCYARMPHMPDMPFSADELTEYQRKDYDAHVAHFGAAGIEVVSNEGVW